MSEPSFPAPKSNEYQWRNLYVKQYGVCSYPPPIPKRQKTVHQLSTFQDHDARVGGGDSGRSDSIGGRGSDNFESPRRWLPSPCRESASSIRRNSRRISLDVRRKSSLVDLQRLSNKQLFSADVFSFLRPHEGSMSVGISPNKSPSRRQSRSSLPSILRTEPQWADVDSGAGLEGSSNVVESTGIPSELLRLQRETWHLLFDNRIMAWFEREANESGRIASRIQRRLLEVVTWTPDQRRRVTIKATVDGENGDASFIKPGETRDTQVDSEEKFCEDEKLMQTLEKFAPFFAVISPCETIQRLASQSMLARQRRRSTALPDTIGMPLFSQYSTWREAYENRRAWGLAPCSFFLVHDASYNYSQVSALYVLLDLVNSATHTHSLDCVAFHHQRHILSDPQLQSLHVEKADLAAEATMCPLILMQRLIEDILFIYEYSAARAALPMAVHVLDFLTDIVLDPDTASRFLSPDALRQQCSYDLVSGSGTEVVNASASVISLFKSSGAFSEDESVKSKRNGSVNSRKSASADQQQQQQQQSELNDEEHVDEVGGVDFNTLKQLNETTFEELFTIGQWFVDAPTANALILPVIDPPQSPPPQSKKVSVGTLNQKLSGTSEDKKSHATPLPSDVGSATGRETVGYIVGRTPEFNATKSLLEAITRYEIQRNIAFNPRMHGQRQRSMSGMGQKRQRKRRTTGSRSSLHSESAIIPELPAGATLLKTPLIFLMGYIRLHGASWLKELLGRLFNILRRESVLLYVNGLELLTPEQASPADLVSQLSSSQERISDSTPGSGRWRDSNKKEAIHHSRLELLEDLICQDIQYVMDEFFNALHGRRSITRLPQGISVMLTSFCTTIHLHLLEQKIRVENPKDKPAVRVRKCLAVMRQKRVIGGAAPNPIGKHQLDATDRLIRSLENHRLAKFILFDCWIIPALNNAVAFGYLPENTPNHLLWNIDAFARYLKIIVNTSLASFDSADMFIHTTTLETLMSTYYRNISSGDRKGRAQGDVPPPQRCNVVKLPRLINGVFDVVTGSLMQLFLKSDAAHEDAFGNFTFGDSTPISGTMHGKAANDMSFSSMEVRKPWHDISGALSSLNEYLGITAGDLTEEEIYEDETELSPLHILNIFCARVSCDVSPKALVSEYSVPPSTVATCVAKVFSLISGQHPIVRNAYLSGALVGGFKSSPYLTCLVGVLLHPRTASVVLGNVSGNNQAFYKSLMKPLQDENLLSLVSSLLVSRKHLPLVNSNELLSLIASVPMRETGSGKKDEEGVQQKHNAQIAAWEAVTRRLLRQMAQITTGAPLPRDVILHPLLQRRAPTNSHALLLKARDAIQLETNKTPLCFDTWWRAMVVALAVKAMNVIAECGDTQSLKWEGWCRTKMQEMERECQGLCTYFTQHKGGSLDISMSKAISCARNRQHRKTSLSSSFASTTSYGLMERRGHRRTSKPKRRSKVMTKFDE